ncbi:unnamed protein product [Ascophyllum nodosum]
MEELQDAIEDVQYLQAVNSKDSGPNATESWPLPSEKDLEDFNTERLRKDPQCYSLETICSGVLGLYLFGAFCIQRKEVAKYEFILDVVRYRHLRTPKLRMRFARGIISKFLGDVNTPHEEVDVLVGKAPLKRENAIFPVDLERMRQEVQTDGGAGANRLGVRGERVKQLTSMVWPAARPCRRPQTGVVASHRCWQDDGDEGGECSRVQTADMSEVDDRSDAADILERHKPAGDACAPTVPNTDPPGHGIHHSPTEAAELLQADAPHDGNAKNMTGRNDDLGTPVLELSAGAQDYPSDLFDYLEVYVFDHLRRSLHADFLLSSHFQEYTRFLHVQHRPVKESDFILFRVLGRGGFGAVNGCKRGASGKLFAMKVMNKRRIKIRQSEDLCWNERRILEALGSPFVVSLKYAFESKNDLFLILDLMTGGDLGFHLQQLGVFTPLMAQYYTARTALGIRHLHQKGIVYRDLKPENVMLDEVGRSKISDMGLACKVTPHLTGACGTRGYWAPEMRYRDVAGKRVPYNECVDWFSLGCIMYEFLRGISPFRTEKALGWCAETIQDKEKRVDKATMEMDPDFQSKYFDDLAKDLCSRLLEKNPSERLGMNGADEILAHPWFGRLDREALAMDQVESPFKPNRDINAAPQRTIGSFADGSSKVSLSRDDQAIYQGWEYTSVDDFQQEVVDFLAHRNNQTLGYHDSGGGCCNVC